jgi:hypothetical protein
MTKFAIILSAASVLLSWSCSTASQGSSAPAEGSTKRVRLKIFYVSIGSETLTPITSENIEKRARPCIVVSQPDVTRIKKIIGTVVPPSSDQTFDDKRVRVKMVEEEADGADDLLAIIDNEGEMRTRTGRAHLANSTLQQLKNAVEKVCPSL